MALKSPKRHKFTFLFLLNDLSPTWAAMFSGAKEKCVLYLLVLELHELSDRSDG